MARRRSYSRDVKTITCVIYLVIILAVISGAVSAFNYLVRTKLIYPVAIISVAVIGLVIALTISNQRKKRDAQAAAIAQEEQVKQNLEIMDRLSAQEFTDHIAYMLIKGGCHVKVDQDQKDRYILSITLPDGTSAIGLVKHTSKDIGIADVRSLYGLVTSKNVKEGYLFSNEDYTHQAKEWAKGRPLQLYNETDVIALAEKAQVEW